MAERHMENLGAAVWRTRKELNLSRSELGIRSIYDGLSIGYPS